MVLAFASASSQRLTCPRQHPFQGRAPGPVSGQLSARPPGGVPGSAACGFLLPFGCRRSLLGHPVLPDGIPPPSLSAYRKHHAYPAHVLRTLAGFTRSARMRPGPGWALSLPRGRRCSLAIALSVAAACRLTSAGPYSPRNRNPTRDVDLSRHQQEFPGSRPVPVLPLTCGRHGRVGDPWVFPRASYPADQEPATHVAVGTGRTQTCSYVFDKRRTSSTSSLITCDLVSQYGRSLPRTCSPVMTSADLANDRHYQARGEDSCCRDQMGDKLMAAQHVAPFATRPHPALLAARRQRAQSLQLRIADSQAAKQVWPVGWPNKSPPKD